MYSKVALGSEGVGNACPGVFEAAEEVGGDLPGLRSPGSQGRIFGRGCWVLAEMIGASQFVIARQGLVVGKLAFAGELTITREHMQMGPNGVSLLWGRLISRGSAAF